MAEITGGTTGSATSNVGAQGGSSLEPAASGGPPGDRARSEEIVQAVPADRAPGSDEIVQAVRDGLLAVARESREKAAVPAYVVQIAGGVLMVIAILAELVPGIPDFEPEKFAAAIIVGGLLMLAAPLMLLVAGLRGQNPSDADKMELVTYIRQHFSPGTDQAGTVTAPLERPR